MGRAETNPSRVGVHLLHPNIPRTQKEQRCISPSQPSSAPAPSPITAVPSVTALTAPPPAVTTTCTGWREGGSGHSWLEIGERDRDRGRRRTEVKTSGHHSWVGLLPSTHESDVAVASRFRHGVARMADPNSKGCLGPLPGAAIAEPWSWLQTSCCPVLVAPQGQATHRRHAQSVHARLLPVSPEG
ncbi:hypothetical protein CDL15_Pgr023495 [Punica granatum]|uniref:Uncharacterized protein n=1 Tax=Punica granatum TaxID=22663 RepID=A0A218W889_PUNGR|nr:hypothetical protein CDL15_Pgr023495 [Punica granatum]PKI59622.1 hypothetical protein CRG98_020031 [Punica granatum]